MSPKFREQIINAWHSLLDYGNKTSPKTRKAREAARKERFRSDALRQQERLANNEAARIRHEQAAEIARIRHEQEVERERVNPTPPNTSICVSCGTLGRPVSRTKGSFLVEIALWLLFCAPGLIYSLWRLTSTEKVCASCGGVPIPVRTPRGTELWRSTYVTPPSRHGGSIPPPPPHA